MSSASLDTPLSPPHRMPWANGWVVGILSLLVVVRIVAAVGLRGGLESDPDAYAMLAVTTAEKGVLGFPQQDGSVAPTALRPPLYPLLLSLFVSDGKLSATSVAVLHALLGALTIGFAYALAKLWGLGEASCLAAGAWIACDPLLLNQASLVMTETLATLLSVVLLVCWTQVARRQDPRWAVAAGAAGALATLCRPTFVVWIAASWLALAFLPSSRSRRAAIAVAFALAFLATYIAWPARNARQLGSPVLFSSHGGYTLLLGNNPHFYDYLRKGSQDIWDAEQLHQGFRQEGHEGEPSRDEVQRDRVDYRLAKRAIRDEPRMFAWASLVRLGRFWQLLPNRTGPGESTARRTLRWAVAAWYAGLYLLAVAGLVALGRRSLAWPWLIGLLLAGSFSLVHLFYWSNIRMRSPVLPVLACLAALGGEAAWRRCLRRKSSGEDDLR